VNASVNAARQRVGAAGVEAPGAAAAGSAAAAAPAPSADRVTLVFSACTAGRLVPCGCSPDQKGGLPRAAALLARWRAEEPELVYVDAGDLLFTSPQKPDGPGSAQAELKARALARGAALLGASALVVGARDLALGPAFPAEAAGPVPLLSAGLPVASARETLLLKVGKAQLPVGLFAAGGPKAQAEQQLAARAAALRAQGARLVVAVLHPGGDRALGAAQSLASAARAAGVDLLVLGRRDDPARDPNSVQAGPPVLLAPEGNGQTLLRVDLDLRGTGPGAPLFVDRGAEGKAEEIAAIDQRLALLRERLVQQGDGLKETLEAKVAELERRRGEVALRVEQAPPGAAVARVLFTALGPTVDDEPAAKALVADYDAKVAAINLAAAQRLPEACPPAPKGTPSFIGVSAEVKKGRSCAACHPTEAAFWARTRHARAFRSLVEQNKQFSMDCISCHVTGWQQPGGVCRIDRAQVGGPGLPTPADRVGFGFDKQLPERLGVGREGVQCEACHGPASEHLRGGEMPPRPAASACIRCHEADNSPHFDYARYLPWVVGPGHGEPLPAGQEPRTRGELDAGHKLGPNSALFQQHEVAPVQHPEKR
jgi:hypothetical protein